jgi:PKD repeat protein
VTQVITVGAGSLPTAAFTTSPSAPGLNETVFFSAVTSTPGAGHRITSYQWTFGDGGTASGANVTHPYTAAGTYTVQLTVTDEVGQSATAAGSVAVATPAPPTAAFTFSPALVRMNTTTVNFNGSASSASVVNWQWDFGDGFSTATLTVPTTTKVFNAAGSFTVTLTVTDSGGRRGTATSTVIVVP